MHCCQGNVGPRVKVKLLLMGLTPHCPGMALFSPFLFYYVLFNLLDPSLSKMGAQSLVPIWSLGGNLTLP
jgi:hypothetical protein